MTFKTAALTLGAALLLAPGSVLADGQEALVQAATAPPTAAGMAGPIRVDRFAITSTGSAELDDVSIAFTNQSLVPATDVVFDLQANGAVIGSYKDSGTFSHGVPSEYRFMEGKSSRLVDQPALQVAKVTFADGSSWQPVRPRRQATAVDAATALGDLLLGDDAF